MIEPRQIAAERDQSQPARSRTGGSTFANPKGAKAWELIEQGLPRLEAGRRAGFRATLQVLDQCRRRDGDRPGRPGRGSSPTVPNETGVELRWEIRRLGVLGRFGQRRRNGGEFMTRVSRHVVVLMGGWSAEREVSLVSGAALIEGAGGSRIPCDKYRRSTRHGSLGDPPPTPARTPFSTPCTAASARTVASRGF